MIMVIQEVYAVLLPPVSIFLARVIIAFFKA